MLYFFACFSVSAIAAKFMEPVFLSLSANILPVLQFIVVVFATFSLVLFTYTDNIDQKLADLYSKFKEEKVDQAQESIAALKKELLFNSFFIIGLLVSEKILGGLPSTKDMLLLFDYGMDANLLITCLRMTIFLLALFVFLDQGKAFTTAIKYRHVVSKKGAFKQ